MSEPTRVVVSIDSMSIEALQVALRYAIDMVQTASPPTTDVVLLTYTRSQLKGAALAAHLGTPPRTLAKGGRSTLSAGAVLRSETMSTLRSGRGCVIVAYYAERTMLEFVDRLAGVIGVVFVPEIPDEIADWRRTWARRCMAKRRRHEPLLSPTRSSSRLFGHSPVWST